MVSAFNGIGAVFVLAPIRPVFTGVDGTLDVAIVMELALHVHGRLVEGSALLVQGFAARFQQIKDFIEENAKLRQEADSANRECERLRRELMDMRSSRS